MAQAVEIALICDDPQSSWDRAVAAGASPLSPPTAKPWGQIVGYVTTGMKSPTLDQFVGMGYLPRQLTKLGTPIEIMVRGQAKAASQRVVAGDERVHRVHHPLG